ncbi:WD domain, G-beta repeat protein [Ancylostoma ceylanicum]|uniref:GATOR2 complex protein WDR24 n=1 Tax=Ancylostoma ceylanicum TaxID=53326 RepID=A0A0D6M6T9_9BILA|nr:WD domain, G-beta repeat protein [Ancylostoma ceylanicum]
MTSMGPLDIPNVRKKSAELYLHDYDLDDDLSIASPPVIKNMVDVDDPVDALSSNREQTHLVAAGCRGVLKVFKVNDEGFEQVIDLRSAKRRLNLFYSPSNVAWSKLKDELIATTSNNGAVVLWDVKKGGIERNYKSHTRSATVVHFHRSNEHLLISGSRDAAVLLYDLRENEPVKKFGPLIQFPAHQGYAASIALNPRERHLIASGGGRDKFIKVWNWSGAHLNVPTYQVETTAPVGRVYWSPDPKNAFHIASCAVVNDMSVHIWDIRRPFLPYASFEDHSDSVTDIWWSAQHPERIVSCGKDGLLVLHWMDQKQSPLSYACDVALDIAPDGLIGVATNSHIPIIKQQEQFLARKVYDQDAENAAAAYREKYEDYVKEMERHGKKIPEPPRILTVWPTHLTRFAGHHSSLYRFRKEARLSPNSDQQYEFAPSNVASGDFYFGAGELTKTTLEKGIENPHYNDFTGLKNEAFALKPDLSKLMFMSMSSDDDGHLEKEHIARMNWNPMQEVVRLLRYHADQTERICPVGDCLCECGTNVVQNQQGKKTAVPNNKALRELIRIRENCYLPTSSTNVHYENSSEDESDLDELTEKEVDEPLSRFSLGSDSSDSETSDSESSEPEELQPWQRNVTLPIERDLLEVCSVQEFIVVVINFKCLYLNSNKKKVPATLGHFSVMGDIEDLYRLRFLDATTSNSMKESC